VSAYVEKFAREFFTNLTLAERRQVLAAGENFPTSALSVLAGLPVIVKPRSLAEIRALDQRLEGKTAEAIARLRVGIVAILARSGEPESMAYLREVYQNSPERRAPIAMSLTQHPEGKNWSLLVDSLRTIDGVAAQEVLSTLAKIDRQPQEAAPFRDVILLSLRSDANTAGRDLALQLLTHWTPNGPNPRHSYIDCGAWQSWYTQTYPDAPPAKLPQETGNNKWSYEELASFLESPEGRSGKARQGAVVFREAECIKCHRFDGRGEGIGPDLTTVSRRFQRKEILESIVYPSHVVSDQYASKMVIAGGQTYIGITAREGDGTLVVLPADGVKVRLAASDIEEIRPTPQSAMPEALLNRLTLEQVADLFAFLMGEPATNIAGRKKATQR